MDRVYVFLIRNDVWIYIICGLGLLWYLNELFRGQGALRRAMFGLERETALRTRNKALLFVFIFGAIAASVTYVNSAIRPNLPPELLRPPTPTINASFAPTIAPTEATPELPATPTSPIAPTVTLSGQPSQSVTGTFTTTLGAPQDTPMPANTQAPSTEEQISGCTPDAIISEPREGATVLGLLNVFGSANTEDFGYYEIDINGPQTNQRWASLVGRRIVQPVQDGILAGNVNLSPWAAGAYEIRLTISNQDEQITHQCSVSILLRTGAEE